VTDPASDNVPAEVRARILDDPWAAALGVEFLELRRGYCRAALRLAPHMVNHQHTPHGGVIFSLADAAFSAACNSHGIPAVALSMTINYLSAATPGTRLVAEASARRQGRRAGFYDVVVSDGEGRMVATIHCVAHRAEVES
jgi:acyl-CoA thioesterase